MEKGRTRDRSQKQRNEGVNSSAVSALNQEGTVTSEMCLPGPGPISQMRKKKGYREGA